MAFASVFRLQVDKGASGIDSRFITGGRIKRTVSVVTLKNEGSRDGAGFKLQAPTTAPAVVSNDFPLLLLCLPASFEAVEAHMKPQSSSAARAGR